MKAKSAIIAGALLLTITPAFAKERLFVLTDIGNEPDDQMSLVRLLLYANEIDIEGIVATTSTWQREKLSPEIAARVIAAYGKVLPSLKLHANGWPDAGHLQARLSSGVSGYGMAALDKAPMSAGATALIAAADSTDERPLWISLWGGGNTLAQALTYVRTTRSAEALAGLIARLRVYSISDQDDAGPWIRREFPTLFYIAKPSTSDGSDYASATWTGISGDQFYRNGAGADFTPVSNNWLETNIRRKGPLGAAYPRYMFIMEGDTPSFLGLIPNGLNMQAQPNWGGWGGRYLLRQPYGETRPIWTQGGDAFPRVSAADTVNGVTSEQATIWRWRSAFQNDFAARMDWTIKPYGQANHPPVVALVGEGFAGPATELNVSVGKPISLDASASRDPDGNALKYQWFSYAEAGFDGGSFGPAPVSIKRSNGARATLTATATCAPNWLNMGDCPAMGKAHVILAVTDNGKPALTRYRRIILTVTKPEGAQ
jgi:hypothetical protein